MTLLNQYSYKPAGKPNLRILITEEHSFDINQYLLPFAIVVGICFVIMLVIVVYKCIQDYRRHRRHRLPKSALKKLPIHKFKDGDPFETCVICLDDFQEGDKLRVLPCDHGYHAKCIDPWLVKTKRICPQCRKKVFESNDRGAGLITTSDRYSDSDSDTDTQQRSASSSTSTNDPNVPSSQTPEDDSNTAPLLGRRSRREYRFFRRGVSGGRTGQRSRRAAGGGTFTSQSSVHAPPRNAVNVEAGDEQTAGPSGVNQSISAVERLQRAFAKESRQQRSGRNSNYRRFENNSSSDNASCSAESSDDSDGENEVTMRQQEVTSGLVDTRHRSLGIEASANNTQGRQLGAKRKSTSQHVNAEVHVVPFDDQNIATEETQRSNKVESDAINPNQKSNLSETDEHISQSSHIVEIHPEEQSSTARSLNSHSSDHNEHINENSGGNVENV
jgi:hypothetical protein